MALSAAFGAVGYLLLGHAFNELVLWFGCCAFLQGLVASEGFRAQWWHQCQVSFQVLLPFLKLRKETAPLQQM